MVKKQLFFFLFLLIFIPFNSSLIAQNLENSNAKGQKHLDHQEQANPIEPVEHYPLKAPPRQEWSFSGPFGLYDRQQLRRGFQVYREVCASCHSLKYVAFRDLRALGYQNKQINAIAAQFEIRDGPNQEGEMFTRPAKATDYFPSPFENDTIAALANNGSIPPDLSLMARARAVPQNMLANIKDMLSGYSAQGPDYITALLKGYQDPPSQENLPEGQSYNPYYIAGKSLSMMQPLFDGQIEYKDGSPQTVDQYAKDVSAFLMWSADPHMEKRKQTGFCVISFLIIFSILLYALKKNIFNDLEDDLKNDLPHK